MRAEFYSLLRSFVQRRCREIGQWEWVRGLERELERFRDEAGFELAARKLRIDRPSRTMKMKMAAPAER